MATRNHGTSRADERENRTRQPRGRKDRARWCGGHVGREHRYVIGIAPNQAGWRRQACQLMDCVRYNRLTRTSVKLGEYWSCVHSEFCEACGKIKRYPVGGDCPDRPAETQTLGQLLKEHRRTP